MSLLIFTDAMQSGIVPPLVPFAQTFAAVITAALTGSLYYIATAPKGDHILLIVLICMNILTSPFFSGRIESNSVHPEI